MADISPTAASVVAVSSGANPSRLEQVTYGGTITAGKPVYLDSGDNKWKLADNNVSALVAGSAGLGIAMDGGGDGQPGVIWRGGDLDFGTAILTIGESYLVSSNVGMIAPVADISTNFVAWLGIALTTRILRCPQSGPISLGVQHG